MQCAMSHRVKRDSAALFLTARVFVALADVTFNSRNNKLNFVRFNFRVFTSAREKLIIITSTCRLITTWPRITMHREVELRV